MPAVCENKTKTSMNKVGHCFMSHNEGQLANNNYTEGSTLMKDYVKAEVLL